MTTINWFPGHMVAAQKRAAEALAHVDIVVEVLDARCPGASINPVIDAMRALRKTPALKILNKVDLADPLATTAWLAALNAREGVRAIGLCCKKLGDPSKVLPLAHRMVPRQRSQPSQNRSLRVMMMGVPNVGKSTLVNALLGRRAAKVSDEPAVTKVITVYELPDGSSLYDTPGLTWPKMEGKDSGLQLAANHLIGVNSYDDGVVAAYLAEVLRDRYPAALTGRYGFSPENLEPMMVIEAIARRRGYLGKGGVVDVDKAATTLLLDYRSGVLGRITVEHAGVVG
jgi:ribosome biogenesis GTPase A